MENEIKLHQNKVVFVGNSNVGKSLLFSKICNSYSFVANYPKTTLEIKRAPIIIEDKQYELIDTPGINSLVITSEEEIATRDILIKEHPELVVLCADAQNISRSLNLYLQIRELDIPIIFCLNMIDEADKKHISINTRLLEEELGIPIIENSTILDSEMNKIRHAISAARKKGNGYVKYPEGMETLLSNLLAVFPEGRKPSRGFLLLHLLKEEALAEEIKQCYGDEIFEKVEAIQKEYLEKHDVNIQKTIDRVRTEWAKRLSGKITVTREVHKKNILENIAWASRHPVWGWPILCVLLYVMYWFVGDGAGIITGVFESLLFEPIMLGIESMTSNPIVLDVLLGDYGLLTMGVLNAIGTVVPILIMFFFLLSVLEDAGYLPNLSVLVTRILQHVGLNGKAVMSLVLALGCNTMATLTTRILETQKERTIAIFIIALGIPCSVQFGIMLAIFASIHWSGIFLVFGTVIGLQLISAILLNRYIKEDEETFFMLELPPLRMPNFKNVLIKTYLRCKWFLVEAFPLFVYGSIALLIMKYTGILTLLREFFKPIVVTFLDLPERVADIFIMVLARREVGAILYKDMSDAGELTFIQVVVGLTAITLFVPCMSNTMVMFKEIGVIRTTVMVFVVLALAILVSGLLNFVLHLF